MQPCDPPPAGDEVVASFASRLDGLSLGGALAEYARTIDGLVLAQPAACGAACESGCAICCHQPLLVPFVELAWIYSSDPGRFEAQEFARRLDAELATLRRWRAAGANDAFLMARLQFADRHPCLLLDPYGRCGAYAVRPFVCRNAFAASACTFERMKLLGSPELAATARALRSELHRRYELARFDGGGVVLARAVFFLPEGFAWLLRKMPPRSREELVRICKA